MDFLSEVQKGGEWGNRGGETGSIDLERRSQKSDEQRERVVEVPEVPEVRGTWAGSDHGKSRRGDEDPLSGLDYGPHRRDSPQMTRVSGT